jgi:uncharacterized protein (DUF1800 family)
MANDAALLLRRAGFGPTAAELAAATASGYEATLARLTSPSAPDLGALSTPVPQLPPDPFTGLENPTTTQRAVADAERRRQTALITRWWLDRLIVADHQTFEKLVFFWHGHWATSIRKVIRPRSMMKQHATLRASMDFSLMAHRMVEDPALMYWLDGQLNTKAAPNENLARELMELFMLGIGHYSERDIKEAGRALTGWKIDYDTPRTYFSRASHSTGLKRILGVRRDFDAHGLVDHLLRQKQCPRFIAARLWFRYASSAIPVPGPTQQRMVAAFPDSMAMLRALLSDDVFLGTAGKLVKQPVEWFVGAMRQLGLRLGTFSDTAVEQIFTELELMGQLPFAPPSVGGWPAGPSWFTARAAQVRLSLAGQLAARVRLDRVTPEALGHLLAIDTWTDRTHAVLKGITDPRHMLTLGLCSPEYLVT